MKKQPPRGKRSTDRVASEPVSATGAAAGSTKAAPLSDGTGGAYPRELPLYTVRELASHLRVSRQTIRRMMEHGQIPFTRVGRQIRFDVMAVRARLERAT